MLRPTRFTLSLSWALLPVAFLGACTSTAPIGSSSGGAPQPLVANAVPSGHSDGATGDVMSNSSGDSKRESADQASSLGGADASNELAIWKSKAFKHAFAMSFVSETDVEPGVAARERETLLELRDLLGEEKFEEGIKLLKEEVSATSNAQFDMALANLYFQRDELTVAIGLYRQATEKHPNFRRAWRQLGVTLVREGRWEEALPALVRVLELGGNDSVTYGLLGFCYSNRQDSLSAESAYRMAVMLDPDTVDWKLQLTRSLFEQERFADAAALCKVLLAEQPENDQFWLLQANAFLGMGEALRAANNFEMVDRLGLSTGDSLSKLANIYMHEELYELAVDAYLRSFERDSEISTNHAVRAAKILTMNAAFAEAGRLVTALEQRPENDLDLEQRKEVLNVRAQLALATGGGAEEARALEKIVELDPMDGRALIQLGQYARTAGDPVKAEFYFERAESIAEFEAEAKVRHAQLLVGEGKPSEALPLLRSAQEINYQVNVQAFLEQVEERVKGR